MPANASDLVLDSKLDTEFLDGCVRHSRYTSGFSSKERRVRVEEIWDVKKTLGRGSFGTVRYESRRSTPASDPESPYKVRAVKVISKTTTGNNKWDYMKELEAIVKFSHPRYVPYFVRSHGWFEDAEFVFIALEYLPLGDLDRFMRSSPAFSEESTRQVVRQLLEGVSFMHESGFAHRDLKPGNILVEATSPEWLVKIADFGISKRAQEGGTSLRTMQIGTFGYMAPEVLTFTQTESSSAYSVMIDIWAIGVIAVELLLKRHPFTSILDLAGYVHETKGIELSARGDAPLSHICEDFLRSMLSPSPANRPSAKLAVSHPWMMINDAPLAAEESLFVADTPREAQTPGIDAPTPASLPWSLLRLTNGSSATQSTGSLLTQYQGPWLDANVLLPNFRHLSLEETKYFVLRSDNALDIESSAAHGIWTSSQRVNKIINKAWLKSNGRVVLFFSVIQSRKFCGVAQMTSELDWDNTDPHWKDDGWKGRFTLNWLCLSEMSFDLVKNVPVSAKTPGFRAIACYDGTEISAPSAFELLSKFTPDAPTAAEAQREAAESTAVPDIEMDQDGHEE